MVNDEAYTYIWSEGEKTGFKTKIITDTVTPTPNSGVKQPEDVSQTDTDFVPPSDVKFTDLAEPMKAVPSPYRKTTR